jgi:cyclohexanecarboxylate-CoA ligase
VLYETTLTREARENYRARGWWPDTLVHDAVTAATARDPHKTALIDARGQLSYQDLLAQAEQCALGLLNLGIRRGDAVLVQMPNWSEFAVAMLALERIGAVINPVAPIFRARELRAMLRLAQPVAAIFPSRFRNWDYAAMFGDLREETPALRSLIAVDNWHSERVRPWQDLLADGARLATYGRALDWLRPSPDDITELMFTSGTTGEPKGVLHTANTLNSSAAGTIRVCQLTGDDVVHMASTVGHQTGFLFGVRTPLLLGATAVLQERWDADEFVRLVDDHHITATFGATPFLADTLRACRAGGHGIASLRVFACGGAPIPAPLASEVALSLACRLVPCWGMTEIAPATVTGPDEPSDKVVSTDGRPLEEVEVSVRGTTGDEVPVGQEGDLFARGAFMFAGYVQGRQFTEQCFTSDGWLITGDRARRDLDGYIRITGRSKDLIIRGGENVPVKEIEDLLLRHSKVRTVALVGLPDERLGELACACVVPEPGETLTLEELQAFLTEQQVTRQFWPERLDLMEELPMTSSGKVQKYLLRDTLARRQVSTVPVVA